MHNEKRRPLFSVIVPIYNIEEYVERCIKSIVNQSYSELEIILVNDGSTDRSGEIAQVYTRDNRVKVIHKENGGLSSARNTGLDHCTGEYVLFVDGDDYIDSQLIEDAYEETLSYNPDLILFPYKKETNTAQIKVRLFDSDHLVFDKKGILESIVSRLMGPDFNKKNNTPLNMDRLNTAWGKVYRSAIIGQHRFIDTRLIGPEDLWFNLNVLISCKSAVYMGNHYYVYEKKNQHSILHNYDERLLEKRFRLYGFIREYMDDNKLNCYIDNLENRIIAEQFQIFLNLSRSKGSIKEKYNEVRRVLNYPEYRNAYENVTYGRLPLFWKIFFEACKRRKDIAVIILVEMLSGYHKFK